MKCSDCTVDCPLRGQVIETVCKDFDNGEPELGFKAESSPTTTQCVVAVMYEPPAKVDRSGRVTHEA
jgi:hypothetical protein